jgi:hypothetical protein
VGNVEKLAALTADESCLFGKTGRNIYFQLYLLTRKAKPAVSQSKKLWCENKDE